MPNLKLYIYGACALFYVATCGVVWYKTKAACEVNGQLKADTIVIDKREKQNEARNLRPDVRAFARVLHGGKI